MRALFFYILFPFLFLLSICPLEILYGISNALYYILYHAIGYRKKVVRENIQRSFPNKTLEEKKEIEEQFYRHLCDLFVETIKSITISKRALMQHCVMSDDAQKLFDSYREKNQSIVVAMGHCGNWEWANQAFGVFCKQPLFGIYHPLSNNHFDHLLYKMRTRFGTRLIAMKDAYKAILQYNGEAAVFAFIADQTPPPDGAHWLNFLNQDTPVFMGTEKVAKKLNIPVVYVSVRKIKRGSYIIGAETIVENPSHTPKGLITELHTKKLEEKILGQPFNWLWSHRRWKHKKKK